MNSTVQMLIPFSGFDYNLLSQYIDWYLEASAQDLEEDYKSVAHMDLLEKADLLFGLTEWTPVMDKISRKYAQYFKEWLLPRLDLPIDTYFDFLKLAQADCLVVEMDKRVFDKLLKQISRETLANITNPITFKDFNHDTGEWETKDYHRWNSGQRETILLAWMEEQGHNVSELEDSIVENLVHKQDLQMIMSEHIAYETLEDE